MKNTIERDCSILESIEKSFKEVVEYKEGTRKLKTLEEAVDLWNEFREDDNK
ncbi:hypothetical protein [Clostridium tertium]|jgi:hypothetical protein|uniref:hypothetical protein n=1 Tax=Clostridium tertium TaxID=1559 RepID=UPI0013795037|nr:hypothetical protein [Clostridium tertium]